MDTKETATIIRSSGTYFDLMVAFLTAQASILNETLKELKVNAAKREEICETFGFAMGEFYDTHWVGVDGKRFFPQLMFSQGFLTEQKKLNDLGEIHASPVTDLFHPIGVDAASGYFEEKKQKLSPQDLGTVTPEDQLAPSKASTKKQPVKKSQKPVKKKPNRT